MRIFAGSRLQLGHPDRFFAHTWATDTPDPCWEWLSGKNGKGYGRVWDPVRKRSVSAHRYAWELTHGAIPDGLQILHLCDNPPCVRPDHLRLGTNSDNQRDCYRKGRHSQAGGANNNAKLTVQQMAEIEARYRYSLRHQLAIEFGVSPHTIMHYGHGRHHHARHQQVSLTAAA